MIFSVVMRIAPSILLVPLALLGCSDAVHTAAADAQSPESESVDPLTELRAELSEVLTAKRGGDADARRRACLQLYPKLQARLEAVTTPGKKLNSLAGQIRGVCIEVAETTRLMNEIAVKASRKIELSPVLAQAFTPSVLKRDFAKVKALVKKAEDPAPSCARLLTTAEYLKSNKSKKTSRLATKALGYCRGAAARASARFHLKLAKEALTDTTSGSFSEHCTKAVEQLHFARPSEKNAPLARSAHDLCLEATALESALEYGHS